MKTNIYDLNLDKNAANYVPLSPLSFIKRTALVYPTKTSIVYGERKYNWSDSTFDSGFIFLSKM